MLINGQGVRQDYAEAMQWFRKAAEQGNTFAINNVGVMYLRGHGVAQDRAEAIAWYLRAAELGNELAKRNLRELGVDPNNP